MASRVNGLAVAAMGLLGLTEACGVAPDAGSIAQNATRGAVFTTFDATLDGCEPGSANGINCNHYVCEDRVYVTGGPNRTRGNNVLADGEYYFAVLAPGAQNGGAMDGAEGNLSDAVAHSGTTDLGSGDSSADRTFTMTNGVLSYSGPHAMGTSPNGQPIIAAARFDATPNPGGVYILAICPVGTADPSQCKYDAFKTARCDEPPPPPECDAECGKWDEGCTPCPPTCDEWCDPSDCSSCTPCL